MLFVRDLKIPLKIDLHARALLSQEKRGYIDSIVLAEDFTGQFYSFTDLNEPKTITIQGQEYPLFSRKVYFKGQPIGFFINSDPYLMERYENSAHVYYSQDESFFPKQAYKTTKLHSFCSLPHEKLDDTSLLLEKRTTFRPITEKQAIKKRTTSIFEYKREGLVTIWIPCPVSTWLKEAIEVAYPCNIYGKITLKTLYPSRSDLNLSLLFIFICQILFIGLKVKKNILLHLDLLLLKSTSQPSISLSSFHQPGKTFSPLFYQLNLILPFSLRWHNNIFKKSIKEILRANLAPNKFSITINELQTTPLFYSCFEDILTPLSDLIHEHMESNLKDPCLLYYHKNYANSSKRKLLLNWLLKESDFLRKDYSYARKETYCEQKFLFPTKKGIGLCLFDIGIELNEHTIEICKDIQKKIITLKSAYFPLYSSTLSLFWQRLTSKLSLEEGYKIQFCGVKTYNFEPYFPAEWDWLLDACHCDLLKSSLIENSPHREMLTFKTNLKSQPIACVVELKGETWVHEIEIVSIHIIMHKGRKDYLSLERERILAMVEYFLGSELPKYLKIVNNWSNCLILDILEEGTGSFVNFPYALRNAFFSALYQTRVLLNSKEIQVYERNRQYGEFF